MMNNIQFILILSSVFAHTAQAAFIAGRGEGLRSSTFATSLNVAVPATWNSGNAFGKGTFRFYEGFDEWMKPFPDEDREKFAEMFNFPSGVYEVKLPKPLGIVFEEIEIGKGVFVQDLVEGGAAERQGIIKPGDILTGVTAIKVSGAKWERRLLPAKNFDFDTVIGAIGSNEGKWGCNDVIMQFKRPDEANDEEVEAFMEFFEPPRDNPWVIG